MFFSNSLNFSKQYLIILLFKPYAKLKNIKILKVEVIFYLTKSKNRRLKLEKLEA